MKMEIKEQELLLQKNERSSNEIEVKRVGVKRGKSFQLRKKVEIVLKRAEGFER